MRNSSACAVVASSTAAPSGTHHLLSVPLIGSPLRAAQTRQSGITISQCRERRDCRKPGGYVSIRLTRLAISFRPGGGRMKTSRWLAGLALACASASVWAGPGATPDYDFLQIDYVGV